MVWKSLVVAILGAFALNMGNLVANELSSPIVVEGKPSHRVVFNPDAVLDLSQVEDKTKTSFGSEWNHCLTRSTHEACAVELGVTVGASAGW